jgi:hypothetical protein
MIILNVKQEGKKKRTAKVWSSWILIRKNRTTKV